MKKSIVHYASLFLLILFTACRHEQPSRNSAQTQKADTLDNCYPEDCKDKINCLDIGCQLAIVECHEISEARFTAMVNRHIPKGKTKFTIMQLRAMIDTLDCRMGHYVEFRHATTGIQLVPVQPRKEVRGKYSIAFFRGLIERFRPLDTDTIEFNKALYTSGTPTVALRLIKVVEGSGTKVEYFGDVTDLFP